MADVKICDRCGKQISIGMHRNLTFTKFTWHGILIGRTYTDSRDDLCQDCIYQLNKFFKGEATDAVIKE